MFSRAHLMADVDLSKVDLTGRVGEGFAAHCFGGALRREVG